MICSVENCCGCEACTAICPKQCIKMYENDEGFCYPKVDSENCIGCRQCEQVCPGKNTVTKIGNSTNKFVEAYAAVCNKEKIRQKSSSGGIFYPIAVQVLKRGGCVFGAAMSKDGFEVQHIGVECEEELELLMGAKYVQSTIGNVYNEVRQILAQGRIVLFSGTPCQVEALYSYLGGCNKEKLITIDLICHGVPSPGVWKQYLAETVGKASCVSFRDKLNGWRNYSLRITDKNGKQFIQQENQNAYMKGYLSHLYCRPSCYQCKFKGLERKSDLTLGDFWRIQDFCGTMDDNKGTSLVFVQSNTGKQLLKSLIDARVITVARVNAVEAAKCNPMMLESIKINRKRDMFFKRLQSYSVYDSVNTCTKKSVTERLVGKFRWILFRK